MIKTQTAPREWFAFFIYQVLVIRFFLFVPARFSALFRVMKTLFFLLCCFASLAQCATISTQPLPQITCEGDSIRLIVVSSGGTFQWEKRRPTDTKFISITNARATRYSFLSGGATHPTGSYYRLKVTLGKCIIYSDSVLVTLRKAPVISSFIVCEKTLISFPYIWTLNGQTVDSIIATPTLNGAKIKAFARYSTLPWGYCILASNEVSLTVTTLPAAPSHAVKLVKACVGLPFSLNATGCSPSLTFWYNSAGVKIGEGSRLLLIGSDSAIFHASCVKSGCEGPLSSGVKAVTYPIPTPPLNTSESYFCSDIAFYLQASGGLNNIWYETASAKASLSTATALAMKAITNISAKDSLLIRFAAVKINDCESSRIPIQIRIKPRLKVLPISPISLTGEKTIIPPETTLLRGTPPIRSSFSSTAKNPMGPFSSSGFIFRTITDSVGCSIKDTTQVNYVKNGPVIHHLVADREANCLTNNYTLKIKGCPLKLSALGTSKRYESTNGELLLSGGKYQILCNDGETDTLLLNLPVLKQPSSTIYKSFTGPICEDDSTQISLEINPAHHFIGWEKEGHLISQEKTMKGKLPAGEYQHVIEENGCLYRSEKLILERRPNPPAPILEKWGAYFVKVKTHAIPVWLIDQKPSPDTSSSRKLTEGREFYAKAKWLYKSLTCYSSFSNVYFVEAPFAYEFTAYPNPTNGRLSIEIAYEAENAKLLLFDLAGTQLDGIEIKNSSRRMDWDISRFPAGTYVLRVIADGISQEKTIRKYL